MYLFFFSIKSYDELFDEIWVASAFKGATNRLEIIPNSKLHFRNHLSWLNLIKTSVNPVKYKGIALTGWSRYDHMQAFCEILPAGIPTLALCLQQIVYFNENKNQIFAKTKDLIQCNYENSPTGFILDINTAKISRGQQNLLYECDFPGSKIYKWLLELKIETKNFNIGYTKY